MNPERLASDGVLTPRAKRAAAAWLDLDEAERDELMHNPGPWFSPRPGQAMRLLYALTSSEWKAAVRYIRTEELAAEAASVLEDGAR